MTDLSQQQPQYFGQPPAMVYAPQQVVYPPPQQPPISYPPHGAPQVAYGNPYDASSVPVYATAPPQMDHGAMSDVPLKSFNTNEQGFVDEHYGGDEKGQGYHVSHNLPSVVTCSDVLNWYGEAWHMYLENWIPYTLLSLFFLSLAFVNFLLDAETRASYTWLSATISIISWGSFPLAYGWFIAGAQVYKEKERLFREGITTKVAPRASDFFRGYYIFCPLFGYGLIVPIFIALGLILFIVPGLYLLVTLSFVPYVYIEYHRQQSYQEIQPEVISYGFCECIGHSRRVVHQNFWEIALFLLIQFALFLLGIITVFGSLVTLPLNSLAFVPAFRALFQFQMTRQLDDKCYCCC